MAEKVSVHETQPQAARRNLSWITFCNGAQFQLLSGWRRQECINGLHNTLYYIAYMQAHVAAGQ